MWMRKVFIFPSNRQNWKVVTGAAVLVFLGASKSLETGGPMIIIMIIIVRLDSHRYHCIQSSPPGRHPGDFHARTIIFIGKVL